MAPIPSLISDRADGGSCFCLCNQERRRAWEALDKECRTLQHDLAQARLHGMSRAAWIGIPALRSDRTIPLVWPGWFGRGGLVGSGQGPGRRAKIACSFRSVVDPRAE